MKQDRKISILICSRNRRESLEILVNSLLTMKTGYPLEVVVVEETNNPVPIEGTRYVPHPIANRGIPFARNLALQNATCELLVFLDDDCMVSEGWLDRLLEPFADDSVIGVQGGVTVPECTNAVGWIESILGFPGGGIRRVIEAKGEIQETREISTLNCAYRASVVEKIGGFEKELKLTGEDYILAKRACRLGRCLFVPQALVYHQARGGFRQIWEWFTRRGRAEIDVIRVGKQNDTTIWTVFRSSLCTKLALLLALGLFLAGSVALLFVVALVLFFPIQYARYYKAWRQSEASLRALFVLPIVKITMDTAMDWGRLRGILFD
jgi:GT2 family glycosyltransferase